MRAKEQFFYDFYFRGQFIGRFNTYAKAKKLVTWPEARTYTEQLYTIVPVPKLSTEKNEQKTMSYQKNVDKIGDLSTGVNSSSPGVVNSSSPQITKNEYILRACACAYARNRKSQFARVRPCKSQPLETATHYPTFSCGMAKFRISQPPAVASTLYC